MTNDPVVLALRSAIAAADSPELRAALGEHFFRAGSTAQALAEFEAGLKLAPASPVLLEAAARAAEATGDRGRAGAYRVALDAIARGARRDVSAAPNLQLVSSEGQGIGEAPATLRFSDVGGMDELKARLERSFLGPLRDPEIYRRFGKRIGGGLVLYGAPGCGKTFLARALAGEIGARFIAVGLSQVLDMWFGESEKRIHEIFEDARRRAPTVLFFDEIDALGQRRSNLRGTAGRTLVSQLLAEMDGFASGNDGVFCLAATNHPWDVDPALRRPGRFDGLLFVPPPDPEARRRILELKLAGRPVAPGTNLSGAAEATHGLSGADLSALVELATELAIEATRRTGKEQPIDDAFLARATKGLKPSTRAWFEVARNHAIYANEGGTYDELLDHLEKMKLA
ncbi:MAG TPA: ATP-binding protein [Myxococcales bacterium]|nr:ATP-binding protein [Myxococcales bacterium]